MTFINKNLHFSASRIILNCIAFVFFFCGSVFAADIEAVLDESAGVSVFSIKSLANVEQAHFDSTGNAVIKGCMRLDSSGVECGPAENLIVDGNVGIGTTGPQNALVIGTTGQFQVSLAGALTGVGITNSGAYTQSGTSANTFTGTTTFSNTTASAYFTGGNVGIGTNTPAGALTVMSGNVGLGTWAPRLSLEVLGTGVRIGNGTFDHASGSDDAYVTGNLEVDGNVWLGDATADSLTVVGRMSMSGGMTLDSLEVTGSTFLGTVSTTSNLGIGTTAADATLEIVKGSRTSPLLMLSNAASGNGDYMIVSNAGNVGIGTNTPAGALTVMNGNVGLGTWAPRLSLEVLGTGVRIGNGTFDHTSGSNDVYVTGNLEVDGNVWLGDATADSLTVVGRMSMSGGMTLDSLEVTGSTFLGTVSTTSNLGIGTTAADATLEIVKGSRTSPLLMLSNAASGNGDYMIVSNAGNVGIGTNTPAGALTVMNGNVGLGTWAPRLSLEVLGTGVRIGNGTFDHASGSNDVYVTGNLEVDGNVWLGDNASVDNLTVAGRMNMLGGMTLDSLEVTGNSFLGTGSATGNLGIGTTAADASFEIVKGARTGPLVMVSDAASGNGNFIMVTNDGNVGISSVTPGSKMDVNGDVRIGNGGTFNNPSGSEDLYVKGNLEVDGSVWLGDDATVDNLTVTGRMNMSGGMTLDSLEVTGSSFLGTGSATGNLGIGTTGADASLEVVKGSRTGPLVMVSDAASGNGNFMMLTNDGNVGISSITPGAKMDVNGDVRIGNGGTFNNPSSDEDLYVKGNFEVDGSVWLGDNATADNLTVTGKMNMTGGMTLDSLEVTGNSFLGTGSATGNLGIGTTGADASLEVVKGSRTGPLVMVSDAASGNGNFMMVTNAGNVGIGSVTPGAKMDVNGDVRIGNGGTFNNPSSDEDLYVKGNFEVDGSVWLGDNATADNLTVTGKMNMTGGMTLDSLEVTGNSFLGTGSATGNLGIGSTAADAVLELVKGSRTGPLMMLSNAASGNGDYVMVTNSGNVGIGSLTPSLKLDVQGAGLRVGIGTFSNPSGAGDIYVGGNLEVDGVIYGAINTDSGTFINLEVTNNSFLGTNGTGNVGIGTTAAEASLEIVKGSRASPLLMLSNVASGNGDYVIVTSTGNVGIGSTAPSQLLDVNGDVRIGLGTFNNNSSNNDLYVTGNLEVDGSVWLGDNATVDNLTVIGKMNMSGGMTLDSLEVTSNSFLGTGSATGNVGIGSTAADASLEVVKGSRTGPLVMVSDAASGNGNLMMVTNAGNVGIGSVSPQSKFTLNSAKDATAWSNDQVGSLRVVDSGNIASGLTLEATGATAYTLVSTGTSATIGANKFGLYDSGNQLYRMVVDTNGNVGVGSSAPGAKMDINGDLRIGNGGTFNNSSSDEDLYVKGNLEVDGSVWLGDNATVDNLTVTGRMNMSGGMTLDTLEVTSNSFLGTGSTTGNVGIGTTAADAVLELVKGSRTGPLMMLSNAASGNGDYVVVTNAGNVGIGSTAPSQLLDVNGDVRIGLGTFNNNSSNHDLYVTGNLEVDGSVWLGDNATVDNLTVTGKMNMSGGMTLDTLEVTSNSFLGTGSTTGNVGIGSTAADAVLELVKGSRTGPLMMLSNAAGGNGDYVVVTNAGNVGIGSTAPSQLLDVNGDVRIGLGTFNNNSSNHDLYVTGNLEVDGSVWLGDDATVDNLTVTGKMNMTGGMTLDSLEVTGNSFLGTGSATGNLGIGTTGADASLEVVKGSRTGPLVMVSDAASGNGNFMMVTNAGNVGIGSVTPGAKMDVNGDVRIGNGGTFNNPSSDEDLYVKGNFEVDGSVWLGDNATADNLTVTGKMNMTGGMTLDSLEVTGNSFLGTGSTTGNLGIGSTAADAVLELVKGSRTGPLMMLSNAASGNGDYVVVTNAGNVGIGSTAPSQLLDVNGDVRIGLGTFNNNSSNHDLYVTGVLEVDGTIYGVVSGTSSGWTNGTNKIYTNAFTDNVGIGTDNPLGKLVVYGGNVGIGTWTPQTALAVANGNVGIGTWTSDANRLAVVGSMAIGSTTYANIAAPTNGLIVSGNVGIGSTAPQKPFNVLSTGTWPDNLADARLTNSGNIGAGLSLESTGTNGHYYSLISTASSSSIGAGKFGIFDSFSGSVVYRMVIDSTGNVGIGTTIPRAGLSVATTATAANYNLASAASDVYIQGNLEVDGSVYLGDDATVDNITITGVLSQAGNFGLGTTTPQALLAVVGGNVGIGTWTADSGRLQIRGGDALLGSGTFDNTSTSEDLYVKGNIESDGTIYGTLSGTAAGWTNGTAGKIYTAAFTDNVGIGTDVSPNGAKLAVWGNVGIGTTTPQTALAVSNGNVGIGTWTADNGRLSVIGGNVGIGTGTTHAILEVVGDGAKELLRINDSGPNDISPFIITSSGNVGVGTTAPGAFLHLRGVDPSVMVDQTSSGGNGLMMYRAGVFKGLIGSEAVANAIIVGSAQDDLSLRTIANTNINFSVNNGASMQMRLTSSGNVGIGSTAPGSALDVNGDVRIGLGTFNNSSDNNDLFVTGNLEVDGSVWLGDNASVDNLTVTGLMNMTGGMTLDRLEVTSNSFLGTGSATGNVGIGTTGADASLELVKGSRTGPLMMVSDAASGNGNFVMVTNAGNVGIGSTTPSQLLDVNGDMRIGLGTFNNNVVNSTDLFVSGNLEVDGIMYGNGSGLTNLPAGTVLTDADNDTKVQVEKSFDEDYIRFDTAFVERMNINPSGNVGIGTTLPNAGVDIKATFAFEPSAATDITVGGGITVTRGVMRIAGSAGAVDITVDPQIVAGIADGQLVVLQGTSNTNTVKLDNGTGLKLSGAVSFTMGNGDMMSLMYDQGNAVWVEISRTDN